MRCIALIAVLGLIALAWAAPTTATASVPTAPGFSADMARLSGGAVYGGFVHFSGGTPRAHRALLNQYGLTPASDFEAVDAWYAVGTVASFRALAATGAGGQVSYIQENARLELHLETAKLATGVEPAYKAVRGGPYRIPSGDVVNGSGVGVAIVDSGADGTHPDLANRIVKNFKVECPTPVFVWANNNEEPERMAGECFGDVTYTETEDSDNSSGHGTHVTGIVGGDGAISNGVYQGVATGAGLYTFGTGEGDSILTLNAAGAYRWILENGATQTPPIRIVTNSWGCSGGCAYNPNDIINKFVNRVVNDKGMVVTFSAGNTTSSGASNVLNGYAKNPTPGVIAVANYDDLAAGTRDNTLAASSSRGLNNATDAANWPDISAPGTLITAACSHSKPICNTGQVPSPYQPFYGTISGTSMAAPHVAGAAALIRQAASSLTPAEVEEALQDSAYKFTGNTGAPGAYIADPQNSGGTTSFDKGAGLLDVAATLSALSVDRDGVGRNGQPGVDVLSPAAGSTNGGTITVSGSAGDGGLTLSPDMTHITGDSGDYQGVGAADLSSLSSSESATGITFTIGVRDVDDLPDGEPVQLRVTQLVNGSSRNTNVNVSTTVTPLGASAANTAPATSASKDSAADTVSFFVPFANLGNPPPNSLGHNTFISSFIRVIQDVAPGGPGADALARPRYASAYPIRGVADPAPSAEVRVAVDGGAEVNATLTGSSPDYSWEIPIDLASLSNGSHTIGARLFLDGVLRGTDSIGITVSNTLPPGAPTGVVAKAIGSAGIKVTWNAPSNGGSPIASYVLHRGATAATVVPLITLGNVLTYTDSAVTNGTKYYYKVSAINAIGEGALSSAASATADFAAPAPPNVTKPAAASLNPRTTVFSGTAEKASTVTVYVDGVWAASGKASSTSGTWSAGAYLTEGIHSAYAIATDGAGNAGSGSDSVSFDVDAGIPDGTINTSNNTLLFTGGTLSGTAFDNRVVNRLVITFKDELGQLEGYQLATCETGCGSGSWTWLAVPTVRPGWHSATFTVYDGAGNSRILGSIRFFKTL